MNDDQPCECCGTKENVSYVIDPFKEEVYDEIVWVYLCPNCYKEYCSEI